jgi:hypothetical protein
LAGKQFWAGKQNAPPAHFFFAQRKIFVSAAASAPPASAQAKTAAGRPAATT